MKRRTMVLMLAAVAALPVWADVANLSMLGKAYGWQSSDAQSSPGGINDGSALWGGGYYGSTAALADGYYYILWEEAQTVEAVRWFGSTADSNRGLTTFTLWMLNDGADPTADSSWTKLGVYDVPNKQQYLTAPLPAAVSTRAIKLSYTDQVKPLTGEFEIYSRIMEPLPVTVSAATKNYPSYGEPENALTENIFSTYGSENLSGGTGFMELDLGGEQAVGDLQIYFRVQSGYYAAPQAFTLRAWDADANDGDGDWVLLANENNWNANTVLYDLTLPEGFTTEKIRLDVTPNATTNFPGGSFGLAGFYLYAPVVPVPEPVTMSLLALGGLALWRRREA